MIKHKKGFTLIELLVVISIISLLSSVVMASVTSARNKAKQTAFRSEIMQFVNALELYRNDKGDYPFEDATQDDPFYYVINNNNTTFAHPAYDNLDIKMKDYMKNFPNPRGNNSNFAFMYVRNGANVLGSALRCDGDSSIPKYVILILPSYWGSNFSDWPIVEYLSFGAQYDEDPSVRCYSLN